MTSLSQLPSETLCLIVGYLDATSLELGLKATGDIHLWQKICSSDARLAIKLEPSLVSLKFPFSRFCQYRSLNRLEVQLKSLSMKQNPSWLLNLPPTLREIDLAFEEAQISFIRPLSASDDLITHTLYSNQGYTVMELHKYFPNLKLLHIDAGTNRFATISMPRILESPFPLDRIDKEPLVPITWSDYMCLRFVLQLPPTITSLKLGIALQNATSLLNPYFKYLEEFYLASALNPNFKGNCTISLDDNSIPAKWPSIADSIPSVLHLLPTFPDISMKPHSLGRGYLALFQQLISCDWGAMYWKLDESLLRDYHTLKHLQIDAVAFPNLHGAATKWPQNLTSLHLTSHGPIQTFSPLLSSKSPSTVFPALLQHLTINAIIPPQLVPSFSSQQLVSLNISYFDYPSASTLSQLPRTLVYLKIKLGSVVSEPDFSGLPIGLKALNLTWMDSSRFTPDVVSALPRGLTSLDLFSCDSMLGAAHVAAMPRSLIRLFLSTGSHFRGADAVAALPRSLQWLSARLSVLVSDEFFMHLPTTLQYISLGSFQTTGSLFPRHLKKLTSREVIDCWRPLLPEGLQGPVAIKGMCAIAFSLGLDALPPSLEKIDLRAFRFATLGTLATAKLPALTSLKIPQFGYSIPSIPQTLIKLVISESPVMDKKSAPKLIASLPLLQKLVLQCCWDWTIQLPTTLTYLRLQSSDGIQKDNLQSLTLLKTLKFGRQLGSALHLNALPPSITKFAIKSNDLLNIVAEFPVLPLQIPNLKTLHAPGFIFKWTDILRFSSSLTSMKAIPQDVISDYLVERLSEAHWKSIGDLSSLSDPKFAQIVAQAHCPNLQFHARLPLTVHWLPKHYYLIPKLATTLEVGPNSDSTRFQSSRELRHQFEQLPNNLTSLSIDYFTTMPHSVAKWLPRTLQQLKIRIDLWNVQSLLDLPAITTFQISYHKAIRPKLMLAIPRTVKSLSIDSATIEPNSVPLFPPNLTALSLPCYCGLASSDLKELPNTLTALRLPTHNMADLYRYLPPSISLLSATSKTPQLYQCRLFEDQYSLPPLPAHLRLTR